MAHHEFSYSVYSSGFVVNTGDVLSLGSTGWGKLISAYTQGAVSARSGDQIWDLVITDASSAPVFRQEIVRIDTTNNNFYPLDTNGMFISAGVRLAAPSVDTRILSTGGNSSAICQTGIPNNVLIPPGSYVSVLAAVPSGSQLYFLSVITDDA